MNVALWLERTAKRMPDQKALFHGQECLATYHELHENVCRLAGGLQEKHGVGATDRIGLFMANTSDYVTILFACWQLGAVVVPVNYKLHPKEAGFILENADARLVFADGPRLQGLVRHSVLPSTCAGVAVGTSEFTSLFSAAPETVAAQRKSEDMAWLFYTSGTTGRPKGVMITHGNLQAMALSYFVDVDEVRPEDTTLYAAPMSHGAGIYIFMHVLRGAAHCVPKSGGFEPEEILSLGRHFGSLHMFAAPTMVRRLVDVAKEAGSKGDGIRTIVYGGGPMYTADIIEAVDVMGPRFVQIYGQGECPMAITALPRELVADRSHPRWRERLASVGQAQSAVEVAILNEDGTPCELGQSGEIVVTGTPVMPGYWQNPEASAKAIRDGQLWTGDVGCLDEDGFVTLTDRSKDVIISGGTNIYPREVEEVLLELKAVAEVSVIGRPHPDWGEEIVACVVLQPGMEVSAGVLDAHCLDHMARFKRPKHYHFLKALPKNTYGKVLKTELRKRFAENVGEDA
ncbi:long-chain acyl-CoA synthetase [Roseibium hamelinense]|uniref:3-methylmercaptopropionyl-CoA ligase n=1 Tax=Roseibium hamelinense TaxID=150831 RepID=A0A562T9F2_9HYPH|nr:AMP-binding protein [Roseibium hamelinense]MTI45443.1 long-chain fatty acid--CoA ligase [Roseibium hamelinense]TWI90185.1 long-chain acyl-CoA synthetase [Roseibium hamelinense]